MTPLLFLALSLLTLTRLGTAQDPPTDLTGFPPCAQTCISSNHGSCALLDIACMCTSQVPTVFRCMQGSCTADDQAATISFAQELCDKVNATAIATLTTGPTITPTPSNTNTPAPTLSPPTSPSPTPAPPADPHAQPPPSPPALSKAATAGIGVGAVFGALALAAGGLVVWRRRRRQRRERGAENLAMEQHPARYDRTPSFERKGGLGLGVQARHEVDAQEPQWLELEAKPAMRYTIIR